MAKAAFIPRNAANYLLDSLPETERRDLSRLLEKVEVEPGQRIYRQGRPIDYVYFPTSAILSWTGMTRQGERAEVGMVGWEGMLGMSHLAGFDASPFDAEVAIAGEALRAQASRVREKFERLVSLQNLLLRYTCSSLTQLAQSSLCGLYHTVDQRLCRWLLTAHDRVRSDELAFTQDTLAGMIGARRPTVSIAAGALQKAGLIRVNRGRVTLVDRTGIEVIVCDCYWVIRRALGIFLEA